MDRPGSRTFAKIDIQKIGGAVAETHVEFAFKLRLCFIRRIGLGLFAVVGVGEPIPIVIGGVQGLLIIGCGKQYPWRLSPKRWFAREYRRARNGGQSGMAGDPRL